MRCSDAGALLRAWGGQLWATTPSIIHSAAARSPLQIPLLPEATSRLAAVDLDWDNLRAVDILAALRSFLPPGGAVTRVSIHPSDYGLQRMATESSLGPQGIWKPAVLPVTALVAGGRKGGRRGAGAAATAAAPDSEGEEAEEEDAAVSRARLRQYERARLRYYYAVIEFDSAASAGRVYDECDGMEFQKSERGWGEGEGGAGLGEGRGEGRGGERDEVGAEGVGGAGGAAPVPFALKPAAGVGCLFGRPGFRVAAAVFVAWGSRSRGVSHQVLGLLC